MERKMTIKNIKQILQDALNVLEDAKDDQEIKMQSNTYFVRAACFLGTREGFLALDADQLEELISGETDDAN
jgi:hypothetical protein